MSSKLSDDSASLCEQIARETRAELGLGAGERVEPGALARLLGIEVVGIAEFESCCPREVAQLTEDDPTALSAVTFFRGTKCMVIVNPNHPHHPEDDSILHELAHVLLEHEPKRLFDTCGVRIWHDCDEAQADYLACALAVPAAELVRMLDVLRGDEVALAAHFDADLAIVAERVRRLGARGESIAGDVTGDDAAGPIFRRLRRRLPPGEEGSSWSQTGAKVT